MTSPQKEEREAMLSTWSTGSSGVSMPLKKRRFLFTRSPSPPYQSTALPMDEGKTLPSEIAMPTVDSSTAAIVDKSSGGENLAPECASPHIVGNPKTTVDSDINNDTVAVEDSSSTGPIVEAISEKNELRSSLSVQSASQRILANNDCSSSQSTVCPSMADSSLSKQSGESGACHLVRQHSSRSHWDLNTTMDEWEGGDSTLDAALNHGSVRNQKSSQRESGAYSAAVNTDLNLNMNPTSGSSSRIPANLSLLKANDLSLSIQPVSVTQRLNFAVSSKVEPVDEDGGNLNMTTKVKIKIEASEAIEQESPMTEKSCENDVKSVQLVIPTLDSLETLERMNKMAVSSSNDNVDCLQPHDIGRTAAPVKSKVCDNCELDIGQEMPSNTEPSHSLDVNGSKGGDLPPVNAVKEVLAENGLEIPEFPSNPTPNEKGKEEAVKDLKSTADELVNKSLHSRRSHKLHANGEDYEDGELRESQLRIKEKRIVDLKSKSTELSDVQVDNDCIAEKPGESKDVYCTSEGVKISSLDSAVLLTESKTKKSVKITCSSEANLTPKKIKSVGHAKGVSGIIDEDSSGQLVRDPPLPGQLKEGDPLQSDDTDKRTRNRNLWANSGRLRSPPSESIPSRSSQWLKRGRINSESRFREDRDQLDGLRMRGRVSHRLESPRGRWSPHQRYDVDRFHAEEIYDGDSGMMRNRHFDDEPEDLHRLPGRRRSPSLTPRSRRAIVDEDGQLMGFGEDTVDSPHHLIPRAHPDRLIPRERKRSLSPLRPWRPFRRSPEPFDSVHVLMRGRSFEDARSRRFHVADAGGPRRYDLEDEPYQEGVSGRNPDPVRQFRQQRFSRSFLQREEFPRRGGVDLRNRLSGGIRRRPVDLTEEGGDYDREGGPQGWHGDDHREPHLRRQRF